MALNPQQLAFKKAYINPRSKTFGNAYQSAISAGYGKEYAEQILSSGGEWVSELIGDTEMLNKAEEVLKETLEMSDEEDIIVEGIQIGVKKRNPALTKIKQDSAKFVAETLGKEKYSKRSEVTGADGSPLGLSALFEAARGNDVPDKE